MTHFDRIYSAASLIVPEIALLATVCVMFLVGPFLTTDSGQSSPGLRHRWGLLALIGLGAAALMCWTGSNFEAVPLGDVLAGDALVATAPVADAPVADAPDSDGLLADGLGPFRIDGLSWFTRGATLALGLVLVLLLWNQIDDPHSAEAQACLLAILAGASLSACANDMVVLFLSLELVSIPTYVLLYLPRRDLAMREATIKYFLLSVFSSCLFLYGASWLYGAAGTTSFAGIAQAAAGGQIADTAMVRLGLMFMLAGLGFRMTAVPFHFYAPDVFQGSTSSAAAMLSFVPKIVAVVALLRIFPLTSGVLLPQAWTPTIPLRDMLALLSVLTMFAGNLLALRQKHLHRLMAYSSVAHAGYMLSGLALGTAGAVSGTTALLFYLVVYGIMTIGVFALLGGLSSMQHPLQTDTDIAGLSRTHPAAALLLTICLFSLTGLPPTAGFLGKLNLFLAAWSEGTWLGRGLAIALAINAGIAAWYYLRLVAVMYLDPAPDVETGQKPTQFPAWIAGGLCTAATILLFAVPQWLWDAARHAAG